MKFTSFATAALAFALPTFAQTVPLTYNTIYDDASTSLNRVACSSSLKSQGYTTFESLSDFPFIGGAYTVTGYDSSACGTCYELTWEDNSIYALAIDIALEGFNLSEEAMDTLTNGQAHDLGTVQVTAVQVDSSYCCF